MTMKLHKMKKRYLYAKIENVDYVSFYHIIENKIVKCDLVAMTLLNSYIGSCLALITLRSKYIICYIEDLELFAKSYMQHNTIILDNVSLRYNSMFYKLILYHELHLKKEFVVKNLKNIMPINSKDSVEDILNTLIEFTALLEKNYGFNMHQNNILTISSIGLRLFRKLSPEKARDIKMLTESEDIFIRDSFLGGRTEIYRPYIKNNLFYYDVNALFPYIMQNYPLPYGRPTSVEAYNITLNNFFGFIKVEVTAPKISLPILAKRLRMSDGTLSTIYPTGSFSGIFFSEELKLAVKHGYVISKIHKGLEFNSKILFNDYVENLYRLRQNNTNQKIKKMIKNLLNGTYGKYAIKYEEEYFIKNTTKKKKIIKRKNVSISSAIASYARIYMYSFMNEYRDNLVYMDTDAIMLSKPLAQNYIDNQILGKFKLVAEIREFIALATKFYIYIDNYGNYIPILRGVKSTSYNISEKDFKEFQKYLYYYLTLSPSQTMQIQLVFTRKTTDFLETYQFLFHNKRKIIVDYQDNKRIKTVPWHITLTIEKPKRE